MYEVKIVKDLCYAPERLERNALDLYLPQGEGPFPLLVFFYGGGLEQGVKEDLEGMGREFAQAGVAVAAPEGFRNRMYFVEPSGRTTHYDKRHLFSPGGEARGYLPGERRVVVRYRGVRFLLLVCYDLRFPVWSRCRGDYDAILCCASWPASRRDAWRTLLRARAIENQCFVAAANRVGCDPAAHYAGDSALVDFRGRTLAEAGAEACTLTGAFDPAAAGEFREAFPAGRDADEFVLG